MVQTKKKACKRWPLPRSAWRGKLKRRYCDWGGGGGGGGGFAGFGWNGRAEEEEGRFAW